VRSSTHSGSNRILLPDRPRLNIHVTRCSHSLSRLSAVPLIFAPLPPGPDFARGGQLLCASRSSGDCSLGSLLTRRWRERDSNLRSGDATDVSKSASCRLFLISRIGKVGAIQTPRPARTPASSAVPKVRIRFPPAGSPLRTRLPLPGALASWCWSAVTFHSNRAV
jgi:hypothetical protein